MAIGPVQLIVLGFNHPDFHGGVIAELERLRESDTVRVIGSIAVYKTWAQTWGSGCAGRHPERLCGGAHPAGAPLGSTAPGRDRAQAGSAAAAGCTASESAGDHVRRGVGV